MIRNEKFENSNILENKPKESKTTVYKNIPVFLNIVYYILFKFKINSHVFCINRNIHYSLMIYNNIIFNFYLNFFLNFEYYTNFGK